VLDTGCSYRIENSAVAISKPYANMSSLDDVLQFHSKFNRGWARELEIGEDSFLAVLETLQQMK
jgi:hypothetical protein